MAFDILSRNCLLCTTSVSICLIRVTPPMQTLTSPYRLETSYFDHVPLFSTSILPYAVGISQFTSLGATLRVTSYKCQHTPIASSLPVLGAKIKRNVSLIFAVVCGVSWGCCIVDYHFLCKISFGQILRLGTSILYSSKALFKNDILNLTLLS